MTISLSCVLLRAWSHLRLMTVLICDARRPQKRHYNSKTTACNIPLATRGRAVSILSILRTNETSFSPEDVDFLSRASGQIAIAVENALAYREISELKDKLAQEKLYLEEEIRSEMDFERIVG